MNGNGKRITVLCILLIVGGGWAGLASRYTSQAAQVQPQTTTGTRSFWSDPNSSPLAAPALDSGSPYLRMLLALSVVIGLAITALYVSKKVLPRVANSAGREIRIIETTWLGPRKALHLVEVGAHRLLIASAGDRITMLAPVDEAQPEDFQPSADEGVEL